MSIGTALFSARSSSPSLGNTAGPLSFKTPSREHFQLSSEEEEAVLNALPWLSDQGNSQRKTENGPIQLPQNISPFRRLRPDLEFFRFSPHFSPMADDFFLVGPEDLRNAQGISFIGYLPIRGRIYGVGVYDLNSRVVQGLEKHLGQSLNNYF